MDNKALKIIKDVPSPTLQPPSQNHPARFPKPPRKPTAPLVQPPPAPCATTIKAYDGPAILRGLNVKRSVVKEYAHSLGFWSVKRTERNIAPCPHDDRLVSSRNVDRTAEIHNIQTLTLGKSAVQKVVMFVLILMAVSFVFCYDYIGLSTIGLDFVFQRSAGEFARFVMKSYSFLPVIALGSLSFIAGKLKKTSTKPLRYYSFFIMVFLPVLKQVCGIYLPTSVFVLVELYHLYINWGPPSLVLDFSPHLVSMLYHEGMGQHQNDQILDGNLRLIARRLVSTLPISDYHHTSIVEGSLKLAGHLIRKSGSGFTICLPVSGLATACPLED